MVYTEIKVIKGKKYKYQRRTYRVGNVVKHTSKYIGAMEPVKKKKSNAGRKPLLKVKELSKEEICFVKKSLRHSGSFVKDRAKIIQVSSEGNTVKQICQKLKFYRPKVEKIIKQFNEDGLRIFERKKNPGRNRRITKEERTLIISYLNTHPEKLGMHYNNWSHKKISA